MEVDNFFTNECVDMVERGIKHGATIHKIEIEGIYNGEIFTLKYTPKEEGYDRDEETEQAEGT